MYIYGDNQASLKISKSLGNYNRVRHIAIKYHYIRNLIEKGVVSLEYIPSNLNLADMLTKVVAESIIKLSLSSLGFM